MTAWTRSARLCSASPSTARSATRTSTTIKHDDYYRLFAFLEQHLRIEHRRLHTGQQAKRAQILAQIAAIENDLQKRMPDWANSVPGEDALDGDAAGRG